MIEEAPCRGEPVSAVALLLIDVINGFDFEGSEALVEAAEQAAPRILALRQRAQATRVPVIYANDNFGRWRSDFRSTVEACSRPEQPGWRVSQLLSPEPDHYFVLKPRHSGFYATALEPLLEKLEVRTLVLCGFAANICVLFTANDAHMRGYRVVVPSDCTASNSQRLTDQTLEQLRLVMRADTPASTELDLERLKSTAAAPKR